MTNYNYKKFTSPKGEFGFPCAIAEPDTKYRDETNPHDKGKFKGRLRLEIGSPEQVKFQEFLEGIWAQHLEQAAKDRNVAVKKIEQKIESDHIPWAVETDKEGEETGFMVYRFNLAAYNYNKKTEQGRPQSPKVFDSMGRVLTPRPPVGPGSEGRFGGTVACYSKGKIGMSLRMEGVQVLKLVEASGQAETATDFGFGEEAGGFSDESFADSAEETTTTTEGADY